MILAVLADETSKKELLSREFSPELEFLWTDSFRSLPDAIHADAYLDLGFELTQERIDLLAGLLPKPVIINSVIPTLAEIGKPFIRLNAWPGFIARPVSEISILNGQDPRPVKSFFDSIHWACRIVPDTAGMVSPRIISMIVNEAFFTLEEEVSSKSEIDTAMKLGTNYPFGPFEWAELIGMEKIYTLLLRLHQTDKRYSISQALKRAVPEIHNIKNE